MISSPCKGCKKQNLPKDICMKNCKVIRDIQDVLMSREELVPSRAIDYIDESAYGINSRM